MYSIKATQLHADIQHSPRRDDSCYAFVHNISKFDHSGCFLVLFQFYVVVCYILWTEYYAKAWGVGRESVSSEEKANKKWIVHVKIDKSRDDSLRGVGRNSILEG